jgi:hypothetical protein
MSSIHTKFAKIWLIAMIVSGGVTLGMVKSSGGDLGDWISAMLFVGITSWGVWFLVFATSGWVNKD